MPAPGPQVRLMPVATLVSHVCRNRTAGYRKPLNQCDFLSQPRRSATRIATAKLAMRPEKGPRRRRIW